jgi:hypothetical protein
MEKQDRRSDDFFCWGGGALRFQRFTTLTNLAILQLFKSHFFGQKNGKKLSV